MHKASHTLEHRAGTTIIPDVQGESLGVEKAMGFHQNPQRGAQPGRGLILLGYLL